MTKEKKLKEKQLYGHFKQETGVITYEKTWTWLWKETLREKLNLF